VKAIEPEKVVAKPTTSNLEMLGRLNSMPAIGAGKKKKKKSSGARSTAFSTMSGFSVMSNSQFFKMIDSPF